MKTFELQPIDGRKSFYNKAKVTELDNGDIELTSYTTIVARIHNGKFERLWNGYSATTMRHIKLEKYVITIIERLCADYEKYGYKFFYEVEDETMEELCDINEWKFLEDGTYFAA